jgi:hypothetical protein
VESDEYNSSSVASWTYCPRLISLLNIMEKFSAETFHILGWALGFTQGFGTFGDEDEPLDSSSLTLFLEQLSGARQECEKIGLRVCVIHITEIIHRLGSMKPPIERKTLAPIATELRDNIHREMRATHFFRLSPDTQFYFEVVDAFGKEVAEAFPSAEYDIKEAGNCLALSRATACVYHSMRILEHGLCALADKFGVPFEHKSWNDVIEPIEKAIRQIKNDPNKPPNWKDEEQFYSEAATQFMHFKNAWRNYTAHKQFKYTETEAEAIFRHVRDFMRHVAKRLKEKKATP